MSCAITAKKRGLDVVVLRRPAFGGTGLLGGVLWIPDHHAAEPGRHCEQVRTFLRHECGQFYDEATVNAYRARPKMVEFFERETEMQFPPSSTPTTTPTRLVARRWGAPSRLPYDIRGLGRDMPRLKPPLKTITFIGMMFNSSNPT